MKKLPSKSFCVLPWIHLNVQPKGDIYPCCMAPYGKAIGNTKEDKLEEVWNNDAMKGIRKDMLKGDKPSLCERCFMIEDTGLHSPRYTHNKWFADQIDELIVDTDPETGYNPNFKMKYWDFRWSNLCNFKCRMCGLYSSSKWLADEQLLYGAHKELNNGLIAFNHDGVEDVMEHVDRFIMEVEEIYFAGGEPLIMDEHYIILEKLIAAGRTDVRLRYNTNFSHLQFKKWDLPGLWKHFLDDPKGHIQLFASLDAVGKLAEVARNGTKWSNVHKNIVRCVNDGMEVHISPTISLINTFHIGGLLDFAFEVGIKPNTISLNNILTSPHWYDIRILPDHLKEELLDTLEKYKQTLDDTYNKSFIDFALNAWKSHIYSDFTGNKIESWNELYMNTMVLDATRNESFLDVNPQYKEWFADIEENHLTDTYRKKLNEKLKETGLHMPTAI